MYMPPILEAMAPTQVAEPDPQVYAVFPEHMEELFEQLWISFGRHLLGLMSTSAERLIAEGLD